MAPTSHSELISFVETATALCEPKDVVWCDGSAEEYDRLCQLLVERGTFTKLEEAKRPRSFLARSDPRDVARVEKQTFICSAKKDDAGPTNNWVDPFEMRESLN